MDRTKNPYVPGAGLQPAELAGRETLLADCSIDMDRVLARRPTKGLLMLGLRGVGKTVLLNRLYQIAENKGFHTIKIEAPEEGSLPQLLAPELRRVLHEIDMIKAAGKKLRQAVSVLRNFASAFNIRIGEFEFGIEPSPGRADTSILQQDLPSLLVAVCEAAAEKSATIGLFIDEVQYLSVDELAAIVVSTHEIAQRNLPFYFVGAGLPQTAALAGNAKSYAERLFNYPEIGPLDRRAAHLAITSPARTEGVEFTDEAVEEIMRITERYPYFIQEWGFHVWNLASTNPIGRDIVEASYPTILKHLDDNFFKVRFDRLTVLQQKYLRAMAELGTASLKTGDIAVALGVEPAAVATVRQQLIQKGMVWSQRHGETAFTVPLFGDFMKRQIPILEKHVPRRREK